MVFHNHKGQVIVWLSQKMPLIQTVELVEVLATRRVVWFSLELSLFGVDFKGGCSRVILALNDLKRCVRTYVFHLLRTYVIILYNWLIL